MPDPPLTGGCGCGAVRFEVTAPLVAAAYCHCTRCRRRTGAAAQASALTAPGALRVTEGEEHLRTWQPDDGYPKIFCGLCGSGLYGESPDDPSVKTARFGAFDGDPGIRPAARQYVAYAAPWEPIPDDGLPRFDERIPSRS